MVNDIDKSTESLEPGFFPTAFNEMGKKQFDSAIRMQKEVLDTIGDMSRVWLSCAQSEVTLASELVGKLGTVRSLPDAVNACQETMTRQMQMLVEDGGRVFAGSERL